MGWESILKGGREYQDFSQLFRFIGGIVKQIRQGKSSKQFQDDLIQPIANLKSSMYEAAIHGIGDYYKLRTELRNYLKQKIAPLNRNYAEEIQRMR